MCRSHGTARPGVAASALLHGLVLSTMLALAAGQLPGFTICTKSPYTKCCSNKKCCIPWKKPTKVKTYNINSGDKCTWVWQDDLAHCATIHRPNPGNLKGSPLAQGKGSAWSATFKTPGTYKVNCCQHISLMRAVIKVAKKKSLSESVNCYGKCYGTSSSGVSCPYPELRTFQSCDACCTIGRQPHAPEVHECKQQCRTP